MAAPGRAGLHRRPRPGADGARPQRDRRGDRLGGRGRARRPLVPRGDRGPRRALRRAARPPRRARPERRCAHPPVHVTAEGNEMTLATHVLSPFLLTRALRPLLEAAARARDRRRLRRHVHPAARRRRPRAGSGRLRRHEDIRALQAGTGRAGRGVDAAPARHGHHRQRHASRLGRHAGDPRRASRLQPDRRAAPPNAGARAPTRSSGWPPLRTPRTSAACSSSTAEPRAKHRLRRTRRPDEAREAARLWQLCTERTAPFTAGTGRISRLTRPR